MAFRKDGDAIDLRRLEGLPEGRGIEFRPDAGDQVGGVEIKVNLAKAHAVS